MSDKKIDQGGMMDNMTLRDWFAGMALQGMLANPTSDTVQEDFENLAASIAYDYANAMIAQKRKGE